jgi:acyl-CoA synthetase (AMP-forming)/AMP-acid ligase II
MMEISTVADIIRQQGSQRPDQPAFVYGERTVTFADLDTLKKELRAPYWDRKDRQVH